MSTCKFSVGQVVSKVEGATVAHEHTVQAKFWSCVGADVGELSTIPGGEDIVSPGLLKLARGRVIRMVL